MVTDPLVVVLSDDDLDLMLRVGARRAEVARGARLRDTYAELPGRPSSWTHTLGAAGELVFARWGDVEWNPQDRLDTNRAERDVGGWQVKARIKDDLDLMLKAGAGKDPPDDPYVLIVGSARSPAEIRDGWPRRWRVVGWIFGRDAKRPCYWRANMPRPCWLVPQADLRAMPKLGPANCPDCGKRFERGHGWRYCLACEMRRETAA